jgi:hypothetical protein
MIDNGATTLWESWKLETEVPHPRHSSCPFSVRRLALHVTHGIAPQVYSQNHVMNGAGVELLWRRSVFAMTCSVPMFLSPRRLILCLACVVFT